MAQRILFPALPNIAEAQYIPIVQTIFAELGRRGGSAPFKEFRDWAKERNLYNKEEFSELLALLGCTEKPDVVLGDFGKKFLTFETPEGQQKALYKWMWGWNPILVKAVFEQLDVEAGGRLHSTHELYRYITSYAYSGTYVTLINFQNWIKWMSATGHIRYIGIRWGLGELGKKELPMLRQFDVDEFLEDEAAGVNAAPGVTADSAPATTAASPTPAAPKTQASGDPDEELPDAPPEAPLPSWPEDGPPPAASPARPAAAPAPIAGAPSKAAPTAPPPTPSAAAVASQSVATGGPAVVSPAWFSAGPGVEAITAKDLGFDAPRYGENPTLFLLEITTAARLVTGGVPSSAYRPFLTWLRTERFWQKWVTDDRGLDDVLEGLGWLRDQASHRAIFGWVALDLLRLRRTLRAYPALAGRLEAARPADALVTIQDKLFDGALTGAAFWLQREMVALGLWQAG